MPTTWWTGNGQQIQQVDTITITAASPGGTVTATINGKSVTYTCTGSDTITTAANGWFALLANTATSPPEFNELTFANPSAGVITATSTVPGTPFTMTTGSAGGATLSQVHTVANSSQSDVLNNANWSRAGTPGIPQGGDDVVVADSSIPLLWNLHGLAAVAFASYTRWQSFTATIGLPITNPNGYQEYRPTDFQFIGSGTLQVVLGFGGGSGPTRERYDLLTQHIVLNLLASGSPQDDYAVALLNTNASSDIFVSTSSLGLAMLPGQTSTVNLVVADGGAVVDVGSGVTITNQVVYTAASGTLNAAPGTTLVASSGASVTLGGIGSTYAAVTAQDGSTISWPVQGTISALVLARSSTLDKSGDTRNISGTNSTLTASTIDGTCLINDPNNCIVYTAATTVNGSVTSGAFIFGPGRTLKLT